MTTSRHQQKHNCSGMLSCSGVFLSDLKRETRRPHCTRKILYFVHGSRVGHPSRAISLYRDNVELVNVVYIALTEGCGLLNSLLDFLFFRFHSIHFFFGGGGRGIVSN